jgi:hypothetical protein
MKIGTYSPPDPNTRPFFQKEPLFTVDKFAGLRHLPISKFRGDRRKNACLLPRLELEIVRTGMALVAYLLNPLDNK